jgi:hypothetical protein
MIFIGILSRMDRKVGESFDILASTSFGNYFVHSYLVSAIKLFSLRYKGSYFHGNFVNFIFVSIIVVVIGTGIVLSTQKIFKDKSRLLIGS